MVPVFKCLAFLLVISFLSGCTGRESSVPPTAETMESATEIAQVVPTAIAVPDEITATFEIYTNGTKRIFTQSMYHRQSADVYIENPNPNVVNVKKPGVTWNDFFATLPFSLTEECLITGTKQTFCSNDAAQLRFFINGIESRDALDLQIQAGDHLVVRYGS